MTRRAFTVDEANALIPLLEGVLARVDASAARLRQHYDRIQVLDLLWGDRLLEPDSPDHAEAMTERASMEAAFAEIERLVSEEIVSRGLRFPQGGLEHGLVDFPTTWAGRWVYLCWRRGEPAVGAWHELDGGFAGRQELTAEHAARMGREDDPAALDDSGLEM